MARRRFSAVWLLWLVVLGFAPGVSSAEGAAGDGGANSVEAASVAVVPAPDPRPPAEPAAAVETPLVRAESGRERVGAAWQSAPATAHARAASLKRQRLEFGLGDLVGPAAVIRASAAEDEPEVHAALARDLAPSTPAFQIGHALSLLEAGETGAATLATEKAGVALARNLSAQLWWVENFAFASMIVLICTSLAFIALAALLVWPHAAHDLGDLLSGATPGFARHAALAALVLSPLVFGEGLFGLVLALFAVGFWYGSASQRSVLVMAAMLFVIGSHPVAKLSAMTRQLVVGDPVVASTFRVLADQDSSADLDLLEAAAPKDAIAAHALAYRDRRYGRVESGRQRLLEIVEAHPSDYVALANLGNIAQRQGDADTAIDYYQRAAAVEEDPTLLFDLSQAYASAFRMEEYEATLARAQRIDGDGVAALSRFGEASLVADLGFPTFQLRDRFRGLLLAAEAESTLARFVAPGRLSGPWYVTAGAFALVVLFGLLFADRWDHASLCERCGHRICSRCEETVWSSEICEDCHRLFQSPEATDPSLRMVRLQALSVRDERFNRVWTALALLIPGMAGFAARRPDLGMLGLILFGWMAVGWIWPTGPFEDPFLMGQVAWLTFALPGVLAAMAYAGVVVLSLVLRKSR